MYSAMPICFINGFIPRLEICTKIFIVVVTEWLEFYFLFYSYFEFKTFYTLNL